LDLGSIAREIRGHVHTAVGQQWKLEVVNGATADGVCVLAESLGFIRSWSDTADENGAQRRRQDDVPHVPPKLLSITNVKISHPQAIHGASPGAVDDLDPVGGAGGPA
jgi:hypothetical protein